MGEGPEGGGGRGEEALRGGEKATLSSEVDVLNLHKINGNLIKVKRSAL